jgi:hypothetical protein
MTPRPPRLRASLFWHAEARRRGVARSALSLRAAHFSPAGARQLDGRVEPAHDGGGIGDEKTVSALTA